MALLQRAAQRRHWAGLEALTVDKYQGRDKDAILISLVPPVQAPSASMWTDLVPALLWRICAACWAKPELSDPCA